MTSGAKAIYDVHVIDHSHIELHYLNGGNETFGTLTRARGKWRLPDIERVIVIGKNIPTD